MYVDEYGTLTDAEWDIITGDAYENISTCYDGIVTSWRDTIKRWVLHTIDVKPFQFVTYKTYPDQYQINSFYDAVQHRAEKTESQLEYTINKISSTREDLKANLDILEEDYP